MQPGAYCSFELLSLEQRRLSVRHDISVAFIEHNVHFEYFEFGVHVSFLVDNFRGSDDDISRGNGSSKLQNLKELRFRVSDHPVACHVQIVHFQSDQAVVKEQFQLQVRVILRLWSYPYVHIRHHGVETLQLDILQGKLLHTIEYHLQVLLKHILQERLVQSYLIKRVFSSYR